MNSENTASEKRVVLFLTMQTSSIDSYKIDNTKLNQISEDFLNDFQSLLKEFEVEKYLRLRDGIVVIWQLSKGFNELNCLRLPVNFQQLINTKSNYYHSRYGFTPKISAVENIYEFDNVDLLMKEKSGFKKHLSDLITLSDLSKASGKRFLISGGLKSLCEAEKHFEKTVIEFIEIPAEELPFSIFSLESK